MSKPNSKWMPSLTCNNWCFVLLVNSHRYSPGCKEKQRCALIKDVGKYLLNRDHTIVSAVDSQQAQKVRASCPDLYFCCSLRSRSAPNVIFYKCTPRGARSLDPKINVVAPLHVTKGYSQLHLGLKKASLLFQTVWGILSGSSMVQGLQQAG